MSKRLNAADPFETFSRIWSRCNALVHDLKCKSWDNLKFDLEGIAEVRRKFLEHCTTPIRSLVCMLILMGLNMKKQRFQ
jgi:hypothetical protein